MIKIVHEGTEQIVTPTLFPDGTSQVWKLDLEKYQEEERVHDVVVVWHFEQEAELIWVNQLVDLLSAENINITELYIPYLPYARQDKETGNLTTFAKSTFMQLLPLFMRNITTLDTHSNESNHAKIKSYSPLQYVNRAIKESNAEVLVFPDKGAYDRYGKQYKNLKDIIVLDKVRDQLTGEILGIGFNTALCSYNVMNDLTKVTHQMLIVDDIADGGRTFIEASLFLHSNFKCEVALYVTHGIFSKGYEKMIDSGINKFYTTQSLLRNINGYTLTEV